MALVEREVLQEADKRLASGPRKSWLVSSMWSASMLVTNGGHRLQVTAIGMREERMVRGTENVRGGRMRFKASAKGASTPGESLSTFPDGNNVQNALAAIAGGPPELGVSGRGRSARRSANPAESAGASSATAKIFSPPNGRPAGQLHAWWTTASPVGERGERSYAREALFSGPAHRASPSSPMRYTRTARRLFEDFVKALSGADGWLLAEVYPQAKRHIVAADGRRFRRGDPRCGKTEPVFRRKDSDMPDAIRKLSLR